MYFLNINKPKGITSFDVIKMLRKKLSIKAIGHSGTLDPLASGVMQVGVGDCTKLLDYLSSDKIYIAKMQFGFTSTTYDDEGEKTFIKNPDFTCAQLKETLKRFLGKSLQKPPKYSAIKKDGQKLCDIARKNPDKPIEIDDREIEIYSIELLDYINQQSATIKVHAKKGTYIRSLCHDIGNILGCGAYVSELKRIAAGNFLIENSDEIESENYTKINPLDVLNYKKKELDDNEYKRILNGNFIFSKESCENNLILLTKNNKLVSIANLSDNQIKPKKVFKGD